MLINPSGFSNGAIKPTSNRISELEKVYELQQELKDIKENIYKIVFDQKEIENNK